jgi:hypothetical protein
MHIEHLDIIIGSALGAGLGCFIAYRADKHITKFLKRIIFGSVGNYKEKPKKY